MKTELILYKQRLENNGDFNIIPDYGWTFTGTDGVDWTKADGKITKVPAAKAQGYQYVLDRATLIVADGDDILADVKKQMGI